MRPLNIALIGLGTVGCGIYQSISMYQTRLEQLAGAPVRIAAIVIQHPEKHRNIRDKTVVTNDINTILNDPEIDVVFEAIDGEEPAFTYVTQCIQAGKHIITSNKEMFAKHGQQLKELAGDNQVHIGYDATTAGGIPIIQTIEQLLKANQIQRVQAILNGTGNYILSAMRDDHLSFEQALKSAQNLGYAEADPTNDVEGYDAFYKLMILSDLIFDSKPDAAHIKRVGISDITEDAIQQAKSEGTRIRHIAQIGYDSNGYLEASVEPTTISSEHPLYAVDGVNNAVNIKTDILGDLTFTGPGAGAFPTASAMIEDLCLLLAKENKIAPVS